MPGRPRRLGTLAAVCSLAAIVAGCSLVPPYLRPPAPVPVAYPAATNEGPPAGRVAPPSRDLAWRSFFTDPALRHLISTALANNRDLLMASARVREARALYRVQSAAGLPAVDAKLTAMVPRAAAGDYGNQAGLSVRSYELDFFGKVESLSSAALHDYLDTAQARRTAQLGLVAEVARMHVLERSAAARVTLAERTLRSRRATVMLVARRVDAGLSSPLDLRQAESLIAPTEADLVEQRLARLRAGHALELLMGYADPVPEIRPPLNDDWGRLQAGLPSDLLTARPDIMAAEERLKAANARIGAARAAFFPSVELTTMGGVASSTVGRLFGPGSAAWQFVPTITLPIFDGGRNEANLDLAQARRDAALADYEKTIQVAFREVSDALAGQVLLERDLRARQDARDGEADRLALTSKRYLAGAIGYLDMLDAERGLFMAEQNLIDAKRARLENAINFYRALGGGQDEPDAAPLATR